MNKIIYHQDCVDGFTAAWVAWTKFGDAAEYVPAHYGSEPPDVEGCDVWILDFSYPREVIARMRLKAQDLRVLDHHKSAAADLADIDYVTFDMSRSGAGIAWDELRGGPRPRLVDYVEDRDLWHWALPRSREVSAYVALADRTFESWARLAVELEGAFDLVADKGAVAQLVVDRYVEDKLKSQARSTIGGHLVRCVNTTFAASETVGALAEGEPFAAGWFRRDDGAFVYSLRSRGGGLDVSEVAKQYGGGGHRNAAGFTVRELLP